MFYHIVNMSLTDTFKHIDSEGILQQILQLVVRHCLDACEVSTLHVGCDKVGVIRVRHQNYVLYHILNMSLTDTF